MKNVERFLKTLDTEEKKHLLSLLETDLEGETEEEDEEEEKEEKEEKVDAKPVYMA